MKTNKEVLSSILKTTQMGQMGIRSVQKAAKGAELKQALADQLREYDTIETMAHEIAAQRGWRLQELSPGLRKMSDMMTRMQLNGKNTDSKIAGMMIKGNTKGVITGTKNLHHHENPDGKITSLAQRLLDHENANIRQMETFL